MSDVFGPMRAFRRVSAECTLSTAHSYQCDTSIASGLSAQIFDEMSAILVEECLQSGKTQQECDSAGLDDVPDETSAAPGEAHIHKAGDFVYPKLQSMAKAKLVEAIEHRADTNEMGVTSMLRSSAQQYLLYRWYKSRANWWQGSAECSQSNTVARPGTSNHEHGRAFDVADWSAWKSHLVSKGFKWYCCSAGVSSCDHSSCNEYAMIH